MIQFEVTGPPSLDDGGPRSSREVDDRTTGWSCGRCRILTSERGYHARCTIHRRLEREARKAKNPRRFRRLAHARNLKTRYGVTPAQVRKMGERQKWRCAICGTPLKHRRKGKRGYRIDHDHGSRRVRGLLCDACNRTLFRLDPGFLIVNLGRIAEYLQRTFDGRTA